MRRTVEEFIKRAEQEGLTDLLSELAGCDPEETVVADADLAEYAEEFAKDNVPPPASTDDGARWLRDSVDWAAAGEGLVVAKFVYRGVTYNIV